MKKEICPELESVVKKLAAQATHLPSRKAWRDYADAKKAIHDWILAMGDGGEYDEAVRLYIDLAGI